LHCQKDKIALISLVKLCLIYIRSKIICNEYEMLFKLSCAGTLISSAYLLAAELEYDFSASMRSSPRNMN
jgi:hypothetical protein